MAEHPGAVPLRREPAYRKHICDSSQMSEIGLRELRHKASELVRRAEAGEHLTVTVAGRPTPCSDR